MNRLRIWLFKFVSGKNRIKSLKTVSRLTFLALNFT